MRVKYSIFGEGPQVLTNQTLESTIFWLRIGDYFGTLPRKYRTFLSNSNIALYLYCPTICITNGNMGLTCCFVNYYYSRPNHYWLVCLWRFIFRFKALSLELVLIKLTNQNSAATNRVVVFEFPPQTAAPVISLILIWPTMAWVTPSEVHF